MRIYWIEDDAVGKLGMMARPRGGDWIEDEIRNLKHRNIDIIVSLLESSEIYELDISKEEEFCEKYGIEFVNYPIEDRTTPKNMGSFADLIKLLDEGLKESKKIVVHCRMGIGRTGMVCAGILIRNGYEANKVFEYLSKKRTLEMPDIKTQKYWIIENKNIFLDKKN